MNSYTQNLNRIEFLITLACTGRCKHCSEGAHPAGGTSIDGTAAAQAVSQLCLARNIQSLMVFGGEPLLHSHAVCKIFAAAREMDVPNRQLITNGFFSQAEEAIQAVAQKLAQSGVNDILLSADAFHQETIPLKPVQAFARAVQAAGIPLRTHPAWLVSPEDGNPYNLKTVSILKEFERMGVPSSEGNVIFPSGNAAKYLSAYFDSNQKPANPYAEKPKDIHAICVSPNGDVLGCNLYQTDILDIIEQYSPD